MAKLPFMQFYPGDWFREHALRMCPLFVRGAWFETLMVMFDSIPKGRLSGTLIDFGRLWGVPPWAIVEGVTSRGWISGFDDTGDNGYEGSAIDIIRQLIATRVCDAEYCDEASRLILSAKPNHIYQNNEEFRGVTEANIKVTLINRRMEAEYLKEIANKNRQAEFRQRKRNAKVTGYTSEVIFHKSYKEPPISPLTKGDFELFWKAYPRRVGKGAAEKAWNKLKPDLSLVLAQVEKQKKQESWLKEGGQFIPHPATWLNQRRWEDDVVVVLPPMLKPGDNEIDHGDSKSAIGWVAPPSFRIFKSQREKIKDPIPIKKLLDELKLPK